MEVLGLSLFVVFHRGKGVISQHGGLGAVPLFPFVLVFGLERVIPGLLPVQAEVFASFFPRNRLFLIENLGLPRSDGQSVRRLALLAGLLFAVVEDLRVDFGKAFVSLFFSREIYEPLLFDGRLGFEWVQISSEGQL